MTSTTKSLQPNLSVWYKHLPAYLLGGLLLMLCASCDQNSIIGRGIINQTEANIIESDTFSIEASTVLADSVTSDRTVSDYMLVGQYTDPMFGKISATSFLKIVPASSPVKLPDDTDAASKTIDSLVLILGLQKYQGDPLSVYPNRNVNQVIRVHRLTEEVSDAVNYYTFSQVAYEPTPLATVLIDVAKLKESKFLRINLTQLAPAFAAEMTNLIQAGTTSVDDFKTIFKGFALVPDVLSNTNIIGFANDLSTSLAVHYTNSYVQQGGAIPNINRPLTSNIFTGKSFHRLQADRTGTPLASLNTAWQPLPAKNVQGNAFMQAGLGVYMQLSFPTLKNLKKLGNVVINKAVLSIKPTFETANIYGMPENIFLYESGTDNKLAYQTINNVRQLVRVTLDGSTNVYVPYDTRDEEYEFALTRHCQYLMSGDKTNPNIMVIPANSSFTVNRAVLSNINSPTPNKMKLRIYYTIFK